MNIPQVNAGVTARNREQTKRICELLGYYYGVRCLYWVMKNGRLIMQLPNGSFTLCQVVGMLEAEDVGHFAPDDSWGTAPGKYLGNPCSPFDLTAAMDALIKVLEAKQ